MLPLQLIPTHPPRPSKINVRGGGGGGGGGGVNCRACVRHLWCHRAGSRPRLPSSCSRTWSSAPPSHRTGSGARTRRARSCKSAWRRPALLESPLASLRPRRGSESPRTCGTDGSDSWRAWGEAEWRPSAGSKLWTEPSASRIVYSPHHVSAVTTPGQDN